MCCGAVREEGVREGPMPIYRLLSHFQDTDSFSHYNNPHRFLQTEVPRLYFPHDRTLGCVVYLSSQLFLPIYLHVNMGLTNLPATVLLHIFSTPAALPISTPPTSLDECFFFNSFVVRFAYSLIFWQFWLFFLFLNWLFPSFGCARRWTVSTYASVLAR